MAVAHGLITSRREGRKAASFSRSRERVDLPPGASMVSPFEQEQRTVTTRVIQERSLFTADGDEVSNAAYDMARRCIARGITDPAAIVRIVQRSMSSFDEVFNAAGLEKLTMYGIALALEGESNGPAED